MATTHSHFLKEWDYEQNTLHPTKITAGYSKKVAWKCIKGHQWNQSPSVRKLSLNGCPGCVNVNSSLIEKMFREELHSISTIKDVSKDTVKIPWDRAARGFINVDATAKTMNGEIIVFEFDGAYWHGETSPNKSALQQDMAKTQELLRQGYMVVRIRQEPLVNLPITHNKLFQVTYKDNSGHANLKSLRLIIENLFWWVIA